MSAELESKKVLSKKVYSETSFQRNQENKKNSEKQEFCFIPSLKSLNKKLNKSLNDLTREVNYELFSSSRNDSFAFSERNKRRNYLVNSADKLNNNNKVAGRWILSLLMLNAWRHQKIELKTTQEKIFNLKNKVEDFEMQVYVLRQLLNAEKKRVKTANDNTHALLQKIEECNKEKNLIIKENENVEKNFAKLLEYCSQLENALKNQENCIITSKLEAENWEKQLEKEREKLKKMEGEENLLREKIQLIEDELKAKNQQIEQLTESNEDLRKKLSLHIPLWDATMDLAQAKLKKSQEIKNELEKLLDEKEKEIKELRSTIELLEKRLQEEDEKNGLLGKSILEKSHELSLIQKKFSELSKSPYPWSGGIIKVASLCAKIPIACICTVGSLLLPLPSYKL